jgi:hypothetical protein
MKLSFLEKKSEQEKGTKGTAEQVLKIRASLRKALLEVVVAGAWRALAIF